MAEPLDWIGRAPRSQRFGDIYFSSDDGLAESRAVFLAGCGLPKAWEGRRRFVVGELGFGTGLNVLALIELWQSTRPSPSSILNIFSVEAFAMAPEDAARALGAWPGLSDLAEPLLTGWPLGRTGFHRIEWPSLGVILDLALLEAEGALQAWSGAADAWFLDGFSPARNPQMWRPEVLRLVAQRSRPGATLASFTVAGAVRRGLQEAGFEVWRAEGFGRKSSRLEGRLTASDCVRQSSQEPSPRVAVIGAGIAGAALVRAFARLGVAVQAFEGQACGAGASGNRSVLVTPRLDAGLGSGARLHAQAFARAAELYRRETLEAVIAEGSLQLAHHDRDPFRFERIVNWKGFDPSSLKIVSEADTALQLGEALGWRSLWFEDALVVEPAAVLKGWAGDVVLEAVERLEPVGDVWRLLDKVGRLIVEVDVVCLAAGAAAVQLAPTLPLRPVRGQVTFRPSAEMIGPAMVRAGWVIPARDGVLYGATHDRDDWSCETRPSDDQRNLAQLREARPHLAQSFEGCAAVGRASLRTMSPDHAPLAGSVPHAPGLLVLSGLGGRGFTLAPLLAEAVAARALGAPSPLPTDLEAMVDPARFEAKRRGGAGLSRGGERQADPKIA